MRGLGWWRARRRWRPPVPHWPSIRGRARADTGPLVLAAAVVAAVSLLAGAAPPLLRAAADDAVRDAVRRAGGDADVLARGNWEPDDGPTGGRVRAPRLAEDLDDLRARAVNELDPALRAALRPPVALVTSDILKVTDGSVLRTFQLAYFADDRGPGSGPHVTWIAGGPPRAAVPDAAAPAPYDGPPWPVQVGLSEADAEALRLRPGDRIPVQDARRTVKDVRVSGIFRATDDADPAWRLAPWLLHPVVGADGVGSTRLAGLLSPDSLPDARLAFDDGQFRRTVRFAPEPGALTWESGRAVGAAVVALKAASGSSGALDTSLRWETRIDAVLRDVRVRVDAASAQASVLLIAIVAAGVLILLLAADLLVHRRVPALVAARQRGATLPDVGVELLLESAAVALPAAVAGLVVARAVTPGAAWGWALPIVVAAAVAGPAFGVLAAARATRDWRVPANRTPRRRARHTGQLRRATAEAGVVIAAVAALVALHQRGILPAVAGDPAADQAGGVRLQASAPTLGVLAGALVLLRLLPFGTRLTLRRSLRSRRPLAVFGAARAAATAARVLPPLVMLVATALACFALTLDSTARQGLVDGAWRAVGADARLDVAPAGVPATAALARRVAAAPGVRQAVPAQLTDGVRIAAAATDVAPRLVIVDAAEYRRLLAATPLPDAPQLDRLTATADGDLPALVRSHDGSLRPGMRLELLRTGAPPVHLAAVGTAPAVGGAVDVVLVDAAAATAAGVLPAFNTVWVTGPGAARAAAENGAAARVVLRPDVLRASRAAPLTAGLLRLALVSAVALLALGLLGLALGAAATAPERWQTLARLRTLGLRPRDARWVAAGELLPAVALAAAAGPALGLLLAHLTLGPLALRLLTGQATDPAPVPPWWHLGLLPVALLAAVAVVVPVESRLRRGRRPGEVLRAGEGLPDAVLGRRSLP
ncbi:FtsX-like permease family protein [Rhizomonospora bruguierae]|uniref:FtsX-like permease family protein n=1 Tax=Rhizomonospora bruguierae TaxID=1581705 RepID=UPI001BCDAC82|nr:FtsX-like permease family protein [Micromonospora sp. NBRC 107566]